MSSFPSGRCQVVLALNFKVVLLNSVNVICFVSVDIHTIGSVVSVIDMSGVSATVSAGVVSTNIVVSDLFPESYYFSYCGFILNCQVQIAV